MPKPNCWQAYNCFVFSWKVETFSTGLRVDLGVGGCPQPDWCFSADLLLSVFVAFIRYSNLRQPIPQRIPR